MTGKFEVEKRYDAASDDPVKVLNDPENLSKQRIKSRTIAMYQPSPVHTSISHSTFILPLILPIAYAPHKSDSGTK